MTVQDKKRYLIQNFNLNPVYASRLANEIKGDFTYENISTLLNEKPKPFVKWVGGKRQLLTQFKENNFYPPEAFNSLTNTYFEPFVGGGAVYFDLLPKNAELSDFNQDLVSTYNIIKDDVDNLIKLLQSEYYIYDKERFLEIRALPKTKVLTSLETAARFIYLNRTCFNGMYRVNKNGEFNVPFGRYNNPQICDAENLKRVSISLKNVTIKQQDYRSILNKARKGDFIYFDPPYHPVSKTASFTTYTNDVFLENEQIELRNTYQELHERGCFVMLSNSDTEFIRSIYGEIAKLGIKLNTVNAGRSINSNSKKRGKISEILVTNY